MTWGRPMCTAPSKNDQVLFGNHCAWMRVPISTPKIERTTDQPIQ